MSSKEYTIYGDDKKVIINADYFDPKKHTKIVQITPENEKKQGGNTQYTTFINNTIANNKNNYNKSVYIKFKPIKLIRNPIFKYDPVTMGKFYTGEDDVKRYNFLISIDPEDEGCKQLEKVFSSIDAYYNGKEFGKYMFTEDTTIIKNNDGIFKVYPLFTTARQNQRKKSAEKNPFKDLGSIKIKLDLDKDHQISTIFVKKVNKSEAVKIKLNKFDDISDYIGKNALIQPIIRLKKVYCSKGETDDDNTIYKCGISAVFEQIVIIESGSTSAGIVHEFINDDGYDIVNSSVVINPTIPRDVKDEPPADDESKSESDDKNSDQSDENNNDDDNEDSDENNNDDNDEDSDENEDSDSDDDEPKTQKTNIVSRKNQKK